ncbi:unnamed protein product [Closterium sp. Naga37s-1]|nr:unnamed protein product [Closterium sp. Naga37s-1]
MAKFQEPICISQIRRPSYRTGSRRLHSARPPSPLRTNIAQTASPFVHLRRALIYALDGHSHTLRPALSHSAPRTLTLCDGPISTAAPLLSPSYHSSCPLFTHGLPAVAPLLSPTSSPPFPPCFPSFPPPASPPLSPPLPLPSPLASPPFRSASPRFHPSFPFPLSFPCFPPLHSLLFPPASPCFPPLPLKGSIFALAADLVASPLPANLLKSPLPPPLQPNPRLPST